MKVKIFTNEVAGGWSPYDLETFLGGSEEAVVLFSEALVKQGFITTVYHSKKLDGSDPDKTIEKHGVLYKNRSLAEIFTGDIFITFKDNVPWIERADCFMKIHMSAEVEKPWDTNLVDRFVNMSGFQQTRHLFADARRSIVVPLGVDTVSLDKNKAEKIPNTVLYCSSPDRGLSQLLQDWPEIQNNSKTDLKLKIAYGFEMFDKIMGNRGIDFKKQLYKLADREDIEWLGQLTKDGIEKEYWKAEYWALPLQNPQSELFCLNALKARYCGCTSVVNKIGSLKNTVADYIGYKLFCEGEREVWKDDGIKIETWSEVVRNHWMSLFNEIEMEKRSA